MAQPIQAVSECSLTNILFGTALHAGAGAAAAAIFTTISPIGGAVFGSSYFLASRLVDWTCDQVNCCPDNIVSKIAKFVLAALGGVAAAAAITTLVGFPMTMMSGAMLTIATIGTALAAIIVIGGCLCSAGIASGIAIGAADQSQRV
jgi:ABC-type branched-subunit amino acid transport system permease subunit